MQPYGLPYPRNVSQEDFEDAYCLSIHRGCGDRKGQMQLSTCLYSGMTKLAIQDCSNQYCLTLYWKYSPLTHPYNNIALLPLAYAQGQFQKKSPSQEITGLSLQVWENPEFWEPICDKKEMQNLVYKLFGEEHIFSLHERLVQDHLTSTQFFLLLSPRRNPAPECDKAQLFAFILDKLCIIMSIKKVSEHVQPS